MHNPDPYPPPQGQQGAGGPPPQQVQPTAIQVSVSQPQLYKVMTMSIMGPHPQNAFCSNCGLEVSTKVLYVNGTLTWLLVIGLCVIGAGLCFWIPLCVDGCKDAEHYCSCCNAYIGTYKRCD